MTEVRVESIAGNSGSRGLKDGIDDTLFSEPNGLTVDNDRNLYICDSANHVIRKISCLNGIVTTFAGSIMGYKNGHCRNAYFKYPTGITIDHEGKFLFVCDSGNHCIRRIDIKRLDVITIVGENFPGYVDGIRARFTYPTGITIDRDSNIYICDSENMAVRKITPYGEVSTFAGGPPEISKLVTLINPREIVIDDFNNLYITDSHCIRKINKKRSSYNNRFS